MSSPMSDFWKISVGHSANTGTVVLLTMKRMHKDGIVAWADNMSPAIQSGDYPLQFSHIEELEYQNAQALFEAIKTGAELVTNKSMESGSVL